MTETDRLSPPPAPPAHRAGDAPVAPGNGDAPPEGPAGTGADGVATTMMGQLTDLLADWEHRALALAERGVDPRPLLGELARNLRAVADQLDGGSPPATHD